MPTAAGQVTTDATSERLWGESVDTPVESDASANDPANVLSMLAGIDGIIGDLLHDVANLTLEWKDAMHTQADSSVDHILLYDSTASDLEKKVMAAVETNQHLQRNTLDVASVLSGMDILANKVKSVKRALDELESVTKALLR